jgi:hypothetical protein
LGGYFCWLPLLAGIGELRSLSAASLRDGLLYIGETVLAPAGKKVGVVPGQEIGKRPISFHGLAHVIRMRHLANLWGREEKKTVFSWFVSLPGYSFPRATWKMVKLW